MLDVIVRKPETGLYVTEIRVQAWDVLEKDAVRTRQADGGGTGDFEAQIAVADVLPLPSELKHALQSSLRLGIQDAELALLLCLCTNLEVLHIELPHDFSRSVSADVLDLLCDPALHLDLPYFGQASSDGLAARKPLQKLQELGAEHCYDQDSTEISILTPLLRLPSLSTVSGYMLRCGPESDFKGHHFQGT